MNRVSSLYRMSKTRDDNHNKRHWSLDHEREHPPARPLESHLSTPIRGTEGLSDSNIANDDA